MNCGHKLYTIGNLLQLHCSQHLIKAHMHALRTVHTVVQCPQHRCVTAVFVAVSHWMHKASGKQKMAACLEDTAQQLAQCIRFPMLSNDFLHFVACQVSHHSASKFGLVLGSHLPECSGQKICSLSVFTKFGGPSVCIITNQCSAVVQFPECGLSGELNRLPVS